MSNNASHGPMMTVVILATLSLSAASCKKFLEANIPTSKVNSHLVFTDEAMATSAVAGIYYNMVANGYVSGINSVTINTGLTSDELINHIPLIDAEYFGKNNILAQNATNLALWSSMYHTIYQANAVLEGIENSSLKIEVKDQVKGEAKFLRAFSYFYLVNLYGDVPLVLRTGFEVNRRLPRVKVSEIYSTIVNDLLDAKSLLTAGYISGERVRGNKTSAIALLSRVYLFLGEWEKSELEASLVISDSRFELPEINSSFLSTSVEAIFQLIHPQKKTYTTDGELFILTNPPSLFNPVSLSESLIRSFDNADLRRFWIDSIQAGLIYYYPSKYKIHTPGVGDKSEYHTVLRLAEVFLIRAEARAMQGKLSGSSSAVSDINVIRRRAGLADTEALSQAEVLLAIEEERKKELFVEWGHRWLDLKRTQRANLILASKPNWSPTDLLFPIPESELLNNPNLIQNPGY